MTRRGLVLGSGQIGRAVALCLLDEGWLGFVFDPVQSFKRQRSRLSAEG